MMMNNESAGKAPSSLAIAEKRQAPARPGGCVGIFFQLFDWHRRFAKKRLFSRKLLAPGNVLALPIHFFIVLGFARSSPRWWANLWSCILHVMVNHCNVHTFYFWFDVSARTKQVSRNFRRDEKMPVAKLHLVGLSETSSLVSFCWFAVWNDRLLCSLFS